MLNFKSNILSSFVFSYRDSFNSSRTQEALKSGHFVSVLQVLMQLQRVCNHPELVVPRETSSSYFFSSIQHNVPSLVLGAIEKDASKVRSRIDFWYPREAIFETVMKMCHSGQTPCWCHYALTQRFFYCLFLFSLSFSTV